MSEMRRRVNESLAGWVSPEGQYHAVGAHGHRDWIERTFPGEQPDRKHYQLLSAGWVRKASPYDYEVGDERHIATAVRHARGHHPGVQELTVGVSPSWKTSQARSWSVPVDAPGRRRVFQPGHVLLRQERRADQLILAKLLEMRGDVDTTGWIDPRNGFHRLGGTNNHGRWSLLHYGKNVGEMVRDGWIRKADGDSYTVGSENDVARAAAHARRHHPEHQHIFVDVESRDDPTSYKVPVHNHVARERLSEAVA